MNYSSFIGIREGYQASVNLEFDLNKIDKIKSYIPTEKSVLVLGDFLRTFYYNTNTQGRATVLIGPYGRGKSHLLLVLSALTSLDVFLDKSKNKKELINILNELCEKIASINEEVGSLAKTIVGSNIRTLPVIVNSNSGDLNQSFLYAMNYALKKAGLQNLIPETYFDSAYLLIQKWKKSFPDAYKKFSLELASHKKSVEDIIVGLKNYCRKDYDLFCSVYPKIAAGTEFNPLSSMDVVKLYREVATALKEQTDYCGINIIFDEFSKFLESNTENFNMLNMKIVQDIAEAATRSSDAQIHFTCVTHKDILDYSSSDSFKTVEGRFHSIRFDSSSEQSYELISNAIIKSDEFQIYKENHALEFKKMCDCYSNVKCFTEFDYSIFEEKIVNGCFPLSPLSVYALLKISEKVGQNERTIFTFLSQNEPNTFKAFLSSERNDCEFITIDYIYNYFEDLFKKELFNPKIYNNWEKANSAIKKASSNIQIKIIKAIALINMISDDRLRPICTHLKSCLFIDNDEMDVAINDLLKKQIIMQRDNLEYVLLTDNAISVKTKIDNYINNNISKIDICNILSKSYSLGYVFPRAYNDKFCMLRYFKNIFIEANTLLKFKNIQQLLLDYPYDGLIINIIDHDSSFTQKIVNFIKKQKGFPQFVVCISKMPFDIIDLLKKSDAISALKNISAKDEIITDELYVFEEDNDFRIRKALYEMFAPKSEYSTYYNCNGKLNITGPISLSEEISKICCSVYKYTPCINNEMVNKKHLNSQNKKARNKVIAWLLENCDTNTIPCLEGNSAEASIYKSVFKHTGLDTSAKVKDEGINRVITEIKTFVINCEKQKTNFSTLYETLENAPFSIRKGLIPVFIAYVLRQYKSNIVLYYKTKEIELSELTLSNINDIPNDYSMLIETGTKDKELYLNALEDLFIDYKNSDNTSVNKLYSVVSAMQNWIRSLPEYTKKYKVYLKESELLEIDNRIDFIRKELLKYEINPRELLFDRFATDETDRYSDSLNYISKTKEILDSHIRNLKKEISILIVQLFNSNKNSSLSSAIINWYNNLSNSTKSHVFDSVSNQLLSIAKDVNTFNDEHLLNVIVNAFVGLSIEDWNDSMLSEFISSLKQSIAKINSYKDSSHSDNKFKILLQSEDGIYEKDYSSNKISLLGETALNNIRSVFEEYNESLNPNEKLAIILKVLKEIIS